VSGLVFFSHSLSGVSVMRSLVEVPKLTFLSSLAGTASPAPNKHLPLPFLFTVPQSIQYPLLPSVSRLPLPSPIRTLLSLPFSSRGFGSFLPLSAGRNELQWTYNRPSLERVSSSWREGREEREVGGEKRCDRNQSEGWLSEQRRRTKTYFSFRSSF
jgi:hypothetical protein